MRYPEPVVSFLPDSGVSEDEDEDHDDEQENSSDTWGEDSKSATFLKNSVN